MVTSGRWRPETGRNKVISGGWRLEKGGNKVKSGGWKQAEIRYHLADGGENRRK